MLSLGYVSQRRRYIARSLLVMEGIFYLPDTSTECAIQMVLRPGDDTVGELLLEIMRSSKWQVEQWYGCE
jgi:hypothetical protein